MLELELFLVNLLWNFDEARPEAVHPNKPVATQLPRLLVKYLQHIMYAAWQV
jgi:hypothetical protein